MKKINYWKCASGMIIAVSSFLYSIIFLIVNKIIFGVAFGILMIVGLMIFVLNFNGEFDYY